MRPLLKEAALRKWGDSGPPCTSMGCCFVTHAVKYEDKILRVTTGARCYIIGTVYKEMKLKPNILDEYHAREV